MNVLILTTSIPALLHALVALRNVSASCDYGINVSLHQCLNWEFNAMRRAAASRNLIGSNRWQRFIIGNMIGSLFIRTYERGIGFIRRCCHAVSRDTTS